MVDYVVYVRLKAKEEGEGYLWGLLTTDFEKFLSFYQRQHFQTRRL